MTELVGNEKLLAVRAEIEALCKRYDIAGVCVLHTPGFVEVYSHLTPSYSKLQVLPQDDGHDLAIRLRSQLADYNGDKAAQQRDLEATAGMVRSLGEALGLNGYYMLQLSKDVDEKVGAQHSPLHPITNPKGRTQ